MTIRNSPVFCQKIDQITPDSKTLEFFRPKTLETLEKTLEKKRSAPEDAMGQSESPVQVLHSRILQYL